MSNYNQPKIAVIGLGAQGLVTVKNLLEQGYDVTGFDKNNFVGGIWHYSAEHRVSTLPSTVVNVSRERATFTDFPFPEGTSSYPTSGEVGKYLNAYCDNFKLRPHLRLGTSVRKIERDDKLKRWILTVQAEGSTELEATGFEKLVVAIGPHSRPIYPELENQDHFKGEIVHSIAFKDPLHFRGKRVMVIGASNTAGDTSTSLIDVASEIYLSHRRGAIVLPRFLKDGTSLDHHLTYRIGIVKEIMGDYLPTMSRKIYDDLILKTTQTEFGTLDPQWNLTPTPSIVHQLPTVTDTLIPALRAGTIKSTASPKRIVGDYDVELTDGTVIQVDSIICCTGYHIDLSMVGQYDPTLLPDGTHTYYTPSLYQNIFSLQHPDSLAFIGTALIFQPAFLTTDLSTMALAQLWSNNPASPSLPPLAEMERWHASHTAWVSSIRALSPHGKFIKFQVDDKPWLEFVQNAAGTNVAEYMGYTSWKAWRYWWANRRFAGLLMDGIWSPHMYRLFPSDRRKTWDGAAAAIERVNEDVRRALEERKKLVLKTATADE